MPAVGQQDCDSCSFKHRCTTASRRKINRDVKEEARDRARSLNGSEVYNQFARDRKKIERIFGEAKRNMVMTRLRLRGITGANDEFLLTATVQNMKRLIKRASRPPPGPIRA